MAGKNIVDSNGTITYVGASEITKGNHNNMPSRTDAYLETDERGHIQASSLGGSNKSDNVVPQSADLNHGAYYSMEHGERSALNNGAEIQSEKTAYVSNQPGGRPDAFIVNDTVSYADGQTQNVHLSFSNLTSEEQNEMNMEVTEKTSDMYDAFSNPGDSLREAIPADEYAQLMEETDSSLPNISDLYEEHIEVTPTDSVADWDYISTSNEMSIDNEVEWNFEVSDDVGNVDVDTDSAEVDVSADDI